MLNIKKIYCRNKITNQTFSTIVSIFIEKDMKDSDFHWIVSDQLISPIFRKHGEKACFSSLYVTVTFKARYHCQNDTWYCCTTYKLFNYGCFVKIVLLCLFIYLFHLNTLRQTFLELANNLIQNKRFNFTASIAI